MNKIKVQLLEKEGQYIEDAYREKTNGSIPSPWMKYPHHNNWNSVVKRIREINSQEPVFDMDPDPELDFTDQIKEV